MTKPRPIELLSPAKNAVIGIEAVNHGADAVYIGAPRFGARAAAGNDVADIARLASYAHRFAARVYVALNTVLTDDELEDARKMAWQLYEAGADAFIIQDMGLLRLDLPPVELHASTQTDNRTVEKVKFLEESGFSQIVLARELSLDQIRQIAAQTAARIECFVHGALCVSYSGQCYASQVTRGRSANRGECAQLCRLPYTLTDVAGNRLAPEGHLLSLKDLDLSAHLHEMMDAGVSSFKIEGRLKEVDYVKNITAYYRKRLDNLLEKSDRYIQASQGRVHFFFEPDPRRTFHRGATDYFLKTRSTGLIQPQTPKSIGQPVGLVKRIEKGAFSVKSLVKLSNGDGLCFQAPDGTFTGIRINRVDGERVLPFKMPGLRAGTMLYRNFDQEFDQMMSKRSAERKLAVDIQLGETAAGFTGEIRSGGIHVALHFEQAKEPAEKGMDEVRELMRNQFSRLGNTDFGLAGFEIRFSRPWFVPVSRLAEWRRELLAALEKAFRLNYRPVLRRTNGSQVAAYPEKELDFRGNIANAKAREFYLSHGVGSQEPALEAGGTLHPGDPVMTTRYCLKFEMGWCPSKQHSKQAPAGLLYLQGKKDRFLLKFDCKRCEMHVCMPDEVSK
jgi:putative protease